MCFQAGIYRYYLPLTVTFTVNSQGAIPMNTHQLWEWDYTIGAMDSDLYDEINSILSEDTQQSSICTNYQFTHEYDDDVPF